MRALEDATIDKSGDFCRGWEHEWGQEQSLEKQKAGTPKEKRVLAIYRSKTHIEVRKSRSLLCIFTIMLRGEKQVTILGQSSLLLREEKLFSYS
jgi:hypothetical protein